MGRPEGRSRSSSASKAVYIIVGTISLGLGTIGLFLPILPTTPFLLLSAACYYKGSDRMHRWLLGSRLFGNYIRNYKEGRGISLKGKILTLLLLWTTICYSAFFMLNVLAVQIILISVAIAITVHVTSLPTLQKSHAQQGKDV